MTYNPDKHKRRSVRLKDYDYSQAGAYFVTICTHDRECILGELRKGEMFLNEQGQYAANNWKDVSNYYHHVRMDEFTVMPNHLHGIIVLCDGNVGAIHELPLRNEMAIEDRKDRRQMLLPKIIGRFKMNVSKHINTIRNTPGHPVWQRNYYEHIIRDENELHAIRQYIVENPLKWDMDNENPVNRNPLGYVDELDDLLREGRNIGHAKAGETLFFPAHCVT
jgi:putative transposase